MKVVTMNLPLLIELKSYHFKHLRQLQSLKADNLERIGDRNFYRLPKLTCLSFPKLRSIGTYNFDWLRSLTHLELNNLEVIGAICFYDLPKLEILKLGKLKGKEDLTSLFFVMG